VVTLGEEVEVMVLEIDEDKRRISLGMKQCRPTRGKSSPRTVKRGDKVKGPIKSITDFGVFVGLAAGIDGLVHLSDLSWNEPGESAVRNYKKGQEVEAIVLAVDVERERISLGIKQLDSDPFTSYTTLNDRGATGGRQGQDSRPARRRDRPWADDVTGYLRASEISRDRVEDARNLLKEGDEVTALIINVDRKTRNDPAVDQGQGQTPTSRKPCSACRPASERENAGTTSLGALLRAKMDNKDNA
jgi:small subunit ribosomal protein S1